MRAAILPGQMSIDEFLSRPEREDGCQEELIEGEIVLSPNTKKRHNDVVRRIERHLQILEERGFVALGEVACRLSPTSLPNTDVAVIRRDHWDAVDPDDFLREAPALAVEVVSPGNRSPKLLTKVDLYLQSGAEQVWLVYPKTRTIKVLTQDGNDREAREGESVEFQGLQLNVSDLFGSPALQP